MPSVAEILILSSYFKTTSKKCFLSFIHRLKATLFRITLGYFASLKAVF